MQFGTIYSYLAPYLTAVIAWLLANVSSKRKAKRNWDNTLRELELTKNNNYKVQGRAYKLQFLLREFERRSIPYTKAASDCNVIMHTIKELEKGSSSFQEVISSCNALIDDMHLIENHFATTAVLVRNVEQYKEQMFLDYINLLDHSLGHEVEIMVHDIALAALHNQAEKISELYSKEKLQSFMKTMDQMQDFMMEMIQLTMDKME